VNVVGELQRKRTLAASRGFLAAARLSCCKLETPSIDGISSTTPKSTPFDRGGWATRGCSQSA